MADDLIDRIYECSFAPDAWPGVFDALADLAGARGGCLMKSNGGVVNWAASESLQAGMSVSINTVRSQVRGVLEKTGCRRQTDAVALLGGIVSPHR